MVKIRYEVQYTCWRNPGIGGEFENMAWTFSHSDSFIIPGLPSGEEQVKELFAQQIVSRGKNVDDSIGLRIESVAIGQAKPGRHPGKRTSKKGKV